jgi:hypothetical protein
VRLVCIEIPLNSDPETAWSLTTNAIFPKSLVSLWAANGLRAGLLPGGNFNAFVSALPSVQLVQNRRISTNAQSHALTYAPPLQQEVTLHLVAKPGAPPVEQRFASGRFQFLSTFRGGLGGGLDMELVPHCNQRHLSLTPRSADETDHDGPRFDALTLGASLGPGQILVIGIQMIRPPTPPGSALPPPRVADRTCLGTALLAEERLGHPVQVLMLFGAEPAAVK